MTAVAGPGGRLGMVHGRYQPFHNGHFACLLGAAARCDELYVGITNPDPARVLPDPLDPLRHLPQSNPFSYAERLRMVKAAALEAGLDLARVHVVPFPVNEPELWPSYLPAGATHYLRLFSAWGQGKAERLAVAGHAVEILDDGAEKDVSGGAVRAALAAGDGAVWRALVPVGVARVLDELGAEVRLARIGAASGGSGRGAGVEPGAGAAP